MFCLHCLKDALIFISMFAYKEYSREKYLHLSVPYKAVLQETRYMNSYNGLLASTATAFAIVSVCAMGCQHIWVIHSFL